MIEYRCKMIDAEGVTHEVRLLRCEGVAAEAPWKWFANIYPLDRPDHLRALAEGDGVTVSIGGRSVEASIVKVHRTDLAEIAGKGDCPWPPAAGP